jgi:hypothetical protein
MNEQLFEKILNTQTIQHPIMKRLNSKGYKLVILGSDADKELPDVHGIPKGYDTYGRGGVNRDNTLFMEGGINGSSSGHPSTLKFGFYWGTKIITTKNQEELGIVYVRGRAGVSEQQIQNIEIPILDWVSKKLLKI